MRGVVDVAVGGQVVDIGLDVLLQPTGHEVGCDLGTSSMDSDSGSLGMDVRSAGQSGSTPLARGWMSRLVRGMPLPWRCLRSKGR
jgi:hypothetical protein